MWTQTWESQHLDLQREPMFPKSCISVECTLVHLTRLTCYEKGSQPGALRSILQSLYQSSGSQIPLLTGHFDSKLGVMIFPTEVIKLKIRKSQKRRSISQRYSYHPSRALSPQVVQCHGCILNYVTYRRNGSKRTFVIFSYRIEQWSFKE